MGFSVVYSLLTEQEYNTGLSLPILLHICIYLTLFIRLWFHICISGRVYTTNILNTFILPSSYLATRWLLLWDWFLKGGSERKTPKDTPINLRRVTDQLWPSWVFNDGLLDVSYPWEPYLYDSIWSLLRVDYKATRDCFTTGLYNERKYTWGECHQIISPWSRLPETNLREGLHVGRNHEDGHDSICMIPRVGIKSTC